jgi:Cdc6-like AAA superfamily ATPase
MNNPNDSSNSFTPEDWKWAADQVALLSAQFHETGALRLFLKKVANGARSAAYGMRASGVWIFGEAGSGKTTALLECARRLEAMADLDSDLPALFLPLLPGPTMHSLVRDLLLRLKYPFATSRTFTERAAILFEALKKKRVRAILIDEVQHVVEGNRVVNQVEIRDFLKRLIDETNVCLVLSGIPSATKLRDNDEQLASRVPAEVTLSADYSLAEGQDFVSAMLSGAPLRFEADASERIVESIVAREKASARLLARVIEEATKAAALSRSKTVKLVHVTHAISFTFLRAEH